jgi:hypothetical protein
MVFKATFNNIPAISWLSVLLVDKPENSEKTTDLQQVTEKIYQIMLESVPITTDVVSSNLDQGEVYNII